MASIPQQFYTTAEIAGLLGVHERTVRLWIKDGKLKSVFLGNRAGHRVAAADLAAFIEARRTTNALTRQLLADDTDTA